MEEKMIHSPNLEAYQAKKSSRSSSHSSICRNSHEITKSRPKIRIIHLFAPEIIKTDKSNFRELVQRLTGKQANIGEGHKAKARRSVAVKVNPAVPAQFADEKPKGLVEEKEIRREVDDFDPNGLISGLEDIDGFIQSLIQFPQIPLDHPNLFEVEKKALLQGET